MARAADKFWLFACRAGDDDSYLENGGKSGYFSEKSRITPAEGAYMLGIDNMIMVVSHGDPKSFSPEAYGYMESFCRMNNVFWSSTGSAGYRAGDEEAFICELAEKYPSIRGAYLDDFAGMFDAPPAEKKEKMIAMLREIRAGLDRACRRMEIWVTWYAADMALLDEDIMRYIDGIAFWTWSYKELPLLPERYTQIEKRFPDKKKLLGIYIFDYPSRAPVPDDMMAFQCDFGLDMLRSGRLDGMIFLTNCVMGIGLSSEYFLRDWIDRVKDTPVPDK